MTLYLQCLSSGLTSDFTEESGLKPRGLRGLDLENVVPSREKRIIVLCDQYALLHKYTVAQCFGDLAMMYYDVFCYVFITSACNWMVYLQAEVCI